MRKTVTPKYRLEASYISFTERCRKVIQLAWDGKPTLERLKDYRFKFNASLCKGGANEHLQGQMSGLSKCWIIEQKTGAKVLEYNPPMLEQI